MKLEKWKKVESDERYSVSTLGRVKNDITGAILKPFKIGSKGGQYYAVDMYPKKSIRVHRLVAMAFIPNKEHKKEVNHIDGNHFNNEVDNLEWVTGSENCKHAYRVLGKRKLFGADNSTSKRIVRIEDGKVFESLADAVRECGMKGHSHLSQVLYGKRKTAGGYHWKFLEVDS